MFKRVRWVAVGYGLGATTSYLAARRLRRAAQKYTPNEVANRVGDSARQVQHAVSKGREAMRAREAELRSTHHIDTSARRRLRTN
jgi:hypothetical protein